MESSNSAVSAFSSEEWMTWSSKNPGNTTRSRSCVMGSGSVVSGAVVLNWKTFGCAAAMSASRLSSPSSGVGASAISSGTLAEDQSGAAAEVKILATAGRIPYDAVCARGDMPRTGATKLAALFQGIDTRSVQGRAVLAKIPGISGWYGSSDAEYDDVRTAVRELTRFQPQVDELRRALAAGVGRIVADSDDELDRLERLAARRVEQPAPNTRTAGATAAPKGRKGAPTAETKITALIASIATTGGLAFMLAPAATSTTATASSYICCRIGIVNGCITA